jgi:hypothetical protein
MKIVFRHLLFPTTLLLILLLLGLALVPGRAFAATKQAQQQTRANTVNSQNDCETVTSRFYNQDVVIVTDYGRDVDCFWGNGFETVGLDDVTSLETGYYDLTFVWLDYHGNSHTTTKSQGTFLSAGNASAGYFAGFGSIAKITAINVTLNTTPLEGYTSCTPPSGAVWIATHANGAETWYTLCFHAGETIPVHLYGVYAIETGGWNLIYYWQDYNNNTGQSSLGYWSLLAPGSATSSHGFGPDLSIAAITELGIFSA